MLWSLLVVVFVVMVGVVVQKLTAQYDDDGGRYMVTVL